MYERTANDDKLFSTIKEFLRYTLVGGSAFFVDTGVLYIVQHFLLSNQGKLGVLVATVLGFIAGLIYNYILSIIFVFKGGSQKVEGKKTKSFLIFILIGLIGLIITELGMILGMKIWGMKYYIIIKVFLAAVVFLWNYVARKMFIFK